MRPLGTRTDRFRRFRFAALGIVLLTVATRLPSLLYPLPINDENIYSVVANEIVDGGLPYIDAVERKPPLLFWTYALVIEMTGKYNWKALHVVALIWTLATMAGLFLIGKGLFDRNTGLAAALFYSVFQPWGTSDNLGFNSEMLMNLPIVWAWAIAFRRSPSQTRPELFVAGALLCAAFLLKQPAAIAGVPLGIYLLLPSFRESRGLKPTSSLIQATMLATGFLTALILVTIVLWKQRILRDAFYWTITDHANSSIFWTQGAGQTLKFVGACLPLIIGAALALQDRDGVWTNKKPERAALLGLVVASAIGVAAAGRFYPHYYIQLIPPLALLAAPHFVRLWSVDAKPRHWLLQPAIICSWFTLTVIAFSISHWIGLASRRHLSDSGRYLLEHSAPEDRIFVWGQATGIYTDARRRPACRYIATWPLTGYVFGGVPPSIDTRNRIMPGAWTALEQDFAKHPPVYIVDRPGPRSEKQYPVQDFPILARLLAERYQMMARTADGVIYRIR